MHPESVDVSAVLITYNEAAGIDACLQALAWCREIVVVDSGSTDATQEICRRHGARVLEHPFEGYGPQKAFAVQQATSAWILSVDADEIVTPELAAEIAEAVAQPGAGPAGYTVPFQVRWMGRRLRFGPTRGERHLRLFRANAGAVVEVAVHEGIVVSGTTEALRHPIVHRPYDGLTDYLAKLNRYTTTMAQRKFDGGRRTGAFAVALRFPVAFFHAYVVRGGVLDGYPGFLYCFFHAVYTTTKYAKLLELTRGK